MIEFEVKSKTQPIGKRKGTDRVLCTASIATASDKQNGSRPYRPRDLGSFRIVVPAKMMDTETEVTADSLKTPKIVFNAKSCHA